MRPSKEDKPYFDPNPPVKFTEYTLIYKNEPDIIHSFKVGIDDNKKQYIIKILFHKTMIHPITGKFSLTFERESNNLKELKEEVKTFLLGFGSFTLKKL